MFGFVALAEEDVIDDAIGVAAKPAPGLAFDEDGAFDEFGDFDGPVADKTKPPTGPQN